MNVYERNQKNVTVKRTVSVRGCLLMSVRQRTGGLHHGNTAAVFYFSVTQRFNRVMSMFLSTGQSPIINFSVFAFPSMSYNK